MPNICILPLFIRLSAARSTSSICDRKAVGSSRATAELAPVPPVIDAPFYHRAIPSYLNVKVGPGLPKTAVALALAMRSSRSKTWWTCGSRYVSEDMWCGIGGPKRGALRGRGGVILAGKWDLEGQGVASAKCCRTAWQIVMRSIEGSRYQV